MKQARAYQALSTQVSAAHCFRMQAVLCAGAHCLARLTVQTLSPLWAAQPGVAALTAVLVLLKYSEGS